MYYSAMKRNEILIHAMKLDEPPKYTKCVTAQPAGAGFGESRALGESR